MDTKDQTLDPTKPGASIGNEPAPQPAATAPKVELKDGAILVDGKKVVPESDLIAAKKSLEGQIERAQTVHNEAMDATKLELSAAQQQVANLNAELTKAKEASKTGAAPDTDVARIKEEVKVAKSEVESANKRILELRINNIVLTSGGSVTAKQLEGKTLQQLDSFEEALKALATSRGGSPGAYALGGLGGGATPQTPLDRAKEVLSTTPVRGTRTAEPATK